MLQHALVAGPVGEVAVCEERLADADDAAQTIERRQQSMPHRLVRKRETIGCDDDLVGERVDDLFPEQHAA